MERQVKLSVDKVVCIGKKNKVVPLKNGEFCTVTMCESVTRL